jgi:hypothetical protein
MDNWVPQFPPEELQTVSPIPRNAIVHCLVDEETRSWNEENIHAFFAPVIA